MRGIVERRVPKRHHRVAHEFVDGALLVENDVAQGREQGIQEAGELLGVEPLGDGGEAAHVAEQQRHVARLAAELEPRRIVGQPLDQSRRHIVGEGVTHPVPLALGAQKHEQSAGEIDRGERDGRIDGIDQPAEHVEGIPGDTDHAGDGETAQNRAAGRAEAIDEHGDQRAEHEDKEELGGRGEVGPLQEAALQDLLDSLGVERDAGHRSIERGGSEIEQTCRARADDQDAAARARPRRFRR